MPLDIRYDIVGRPRSANKSTLGRRFAWTPFSVLNAMSKDWQRRKREWLSLGIKSELGRGENLLKFSETVSYHTTEDGKKVIGLNSDRHPIPDGGIGKSSVWLGADKKPLGGNTAVNAYGANAIPGRAGTTSKPPKSVWLGSEGKPIGEGAINEKKGNTHLSTVNGLTIRTNTDPYRQGNFIGDEGVQSGTSIFDPVLCEIMYKWFTPRNGIILDPFAGGSVRGVVAGYLGYTYVGIDLRPEQILANERQAEKICPDNLPFWIEGDSRNILDLVDGIKCDMIFSCPPYFDLELYSGDKRDLSNCSWEQFCKDYTQIIVNACSLLKNNRFACFVVGDVRDKQGFYRNFPGLTIQAFEEAGLKLYNECILVTATGSLPLRINKQFSGSRKVGKTHQNVYCFVKGDPREAAQSLPELQI